MATNQVSIQVTPENALVDEKLSIIISGLEPKQIVTIRMKESGVAGGFFEGESYAVFEADSLGEVHVANQKPLAGTYEDVDSMGLFWSVKVDMLKFNRSLQLDKLVFEPTFATITITVEIENQVVAEKKFRRNFISPEITITSVRENGLVAKFFHNPSAPPAPGLIVVGGSEGGLTSSSLWAALFASHGYPTLSLAYFQCEDLPDNIKAIPLEYVGEAIRWMQLQENVDANRIGMFGRSKGGELSLIAGATFPEIKAVMAFSPSSVVCIGSCPCSEGKEEHAPQSSWSYQGNPLPFVEWNKEHCEEALRRIRNFERFDHVHAGTMSDPQMVEKATIPVEKINGPVMFVSSDDDHFWPADQHCERMIERLQQNNFPHQVVHLNYHDTGHGIRYPYVQSTMIRLNGGTARNNAYASEHSYRRLFEFLQEAFATDRSV